MTYNLKWRPVEAKWYHRVFLWVLKDCTVRELDYVYHYKVLLGRAYFYKTEYSKRDEGATRAERRRYAREKKIIYHHNKYRKDFELRTKAEDLILTPQLLTKEKYGQSFANTQADS